MELVKSTIRHPIVSRLWGISIWVILTFAITVWWYKQTIDTIVNDISNIKPAMVQLQIDVAVIKSNMNMVKNNLFDNK